MVELPEDQKSLRTSLVVSIQHKNVTDGRTDRHATAQCRAAINKPWQTCLDVGADVFGNIATVTLRQNCNFLLNVFDFILRFLEIDDLYRDRLLRPSVNAFIDLAERTFANALLFRK